MINTLQPGHVSCRNGFSAICAQSQNTGNAHHCLGHSHRMGVHPFHATSTKCRLSLEHKDPMSDNCPALVLCW
jgi:hypothetical protein